MPDRHRPLSDEEKREFVARFFVHLAGPPFDNTLLDTSWFRQRLIDRSQLLPGEQKKEIENAVENFRDQSIFARGPKEASQGSDFHFLRFSQRNGHPTALFRWIYPEGHFSYFELSLAASRPEGKVIADDTYQYLQGDFLSEYAIQAFLFARSTVKPEVLTDLLGGSSLSSEELGETKRFLNQIADHEWKECLTTYRTLPKAVKRLRTFLTMRHEAALKLQDREEVVASIEDCREHYPNDMMTFLREYEYLRIMGKFNDALTVLDRIGTEIPEDAYLDVHRSFLYERDKKLSLAKDYADRAIELEPSLRAAYFQAAKIAFAQGDYRETVGVFRAAEREIGLTPEMVAKLQGYQELLKSAEFQSWKEEERP